MEYSIGTLLGMAFTILVVLAVILRVVKRLFRKKTHEE